MTEKKGTVSFKQITNFILLFSILFFQLVSMIPTNIQAADGVTWIPFIGEADPGTLSQILPKSRDTMGFCVDSNFYGMYDMPIYVNATRFNVLQVPGAGYATEVGKPAVPKMTRYFEAPFGVEIDIEVLYSEMQDLARINVFPAQEPRADYANAAEPPFVIDETIYHTDAFYPSEIASVDGTMGSDPIVIRGHRIVALNLYPVQFNPVTQRARVYSKIEVRLKYDTPGQVEVIDERLDSPAFDALLDAFILNYQYRPQSNEAALQKSTLSALAGEKTVEYEVGAEYLIITHEDFYQQAANLADWKEQKGLTTRIVNTTQIKTPNPTADDITTYIKHAYTTWQPAPTYILLMGDAEFIPTHYNTIHPWDEHGGFHIASDLNYTTVDGTDYFPDIYIGRFSVDTAAQATTLVDKVIAYERNPPTDTDFYNQISATAYFQDQKHPECGKEYPVDGYEDRGYVLTCEEIRDYLTGSLGYDVDRIYWADTTVTPTHYSICAFDAGSPLPNALLRTSGFAWDGDAQDVTNNITDGRFLIYHRDHGASRNLFNHELNPTTGAPYGFVKTFDGWDHPDYTTVDINNLTNGPLLPVVLSIDCQCGWFDGETDQGDDSSLTNNFESFCEEFVRRQNGGAVAAIGATRDSASIYNDQMIRGFIDAIWPGFDPNFASGGLFNLGQVLTYGKVYMANIYGYKGKYTNMTFELFHLFGDPELAIWTEQPREFDVYYPFLIGSQGVQQFFVKVTDSGTHAPVKYAKVCLNKEDDVFGVAYTNPEGQAYFSVEPASSGPMTITVTKHNYEPFQDDIPVTANGATLTVSPEFCPPGINLTLVGSNFEDEVVDIYFESLLPVSSVTASGGSFTLSNFTVPVGPDGPINVIAVGQNSQPAAVTLFRRLPEQPLPDPYLYDQWAPSTWTLTPDENDPHWDNPDIQLINKTTGAKVSSNDLKVGTTYLIEATIHNTPAADAVDCEVSFKWAKWGAGQKDWTYILPSPKVTVLKNGVEKAHVEWTPHLTGHTCIQVEVFHKWDTVANNVGQENTNVHPVSSPGEINFTLSNPTDAAALIYLEARQISGEDLWATYLQRDYPQVQGPEEDREGILVVDPPLDIPEGEKRVYAVSCYINGDLIGGMEIEVVKKMSSTISCAASPSEILIGETIAISGAISPVVSGETIILTYERPDGSQVNIPVATDLNGGYSSSYVPDVEGSWSVAASWDGDPLHYGGLSSPTAFLVSSQPFFLTPWGIIIMIAAIIILIVMGLLVVRRRS